MYRAKDEKMEKPYNPRHGFTMKNLTVEDSDIYRCSIEKDGIKQDIYYILHVQCKYDRLEKSIQPYI